jgi:hypothetical protein
MAFFDVQDADLFFGRERLTADLITHLHRQPFLAVVGASGSGKSSIVRAGVIPTLQGNKHIDDVLLPDECMTWPMHLITPGNHPLQALAISLANSPQEAVALMNSFVDDVHSLHMAVRFKLRDSPTSRLLLFVDQFEELFTQCQVESERQAFIDNLMTAVHPETGRYLILIITLRADFYAACARYDALRLALAKQQIYIGAMNQIELRQAIEQPAYLNNWQFQPGLVDLMLRDVGHEPGRLPLLSHALLETWQRRRKRCLTFDGYIEAGGIQGAITETAERTYSQLTFDQQRIARHIFLRLTQ